MNEDDKKIDESLEAFREIVGILERLDPDYRERTVRAAMIMVELPFKPGENHG